MQAKILAMQDEITLLKNVIITRRDLQPNFQEMVECSGEVGKKECKLKRDYGEGR